MTHVGIIDERMRSFAWFDPKHTALIVDEQGKPDTDARSLYMAFLEIGAESGFVYASQQRLADRAGISVSTLNRRIDILVSKQLIHRASDEEVIALSERIGYSPPSVVWKLTTPDERVTLAAASEASMPDMPLEERLIQAIKAAQPAMQRKVAVKILAQHWQMAGMGKLTPGEYAWLQKIVNSVKGEAGPKALAKALQQTIANRPKGQHPFVYLSSRVKALTDTPAMALHLQPVERNEGAVRTADVEGEAFEFEV